MSILFLSEDKNHIARAFTPDRLADYPVMSACELPPEGMPHVDTIFSTWGMPAMSEKEIRALLPNLRYLFYAAGTVQNFARPFLESGVRVFSAWAANAVPVAEFTAAQIVLANKGYFQMHDRYRDAGYHAAGAYGDSFGGNYGALVGLLGAGMIGRHVIKLLTAYNITIKVYDPYLSQEDACSLNVTKASLSDIFSSCQTISNHMADKAETRGILNDSLFSLMKKNAVFINTGRGRQADMEDLMRAMTEEPDRTALLDVTDPLEPLALDHPVWKLPNVFITPHRAGSNSLEILRMGEYMFDEFERLSSGQPPKYEVTLDMLERMA